MSEQQGTLPSAKPQRRTKPKPPPGVMGPGEFFTALIQGLLADGGVPGAFSNSSIEMLSNPINALKWYASYLVLCENYEKAISGDMRVALKQFPAGIRDKVAELTGSD